MEHKDVPVNTFALGCFLGYNTFVAHFDSTNTTTPPPPPSSSKCSSSPSGKQMSLKQGKKGRGAKSSSPSEGTSSAGKTSSPNSELTSSEGFKVTQCNAHFEHCSNGLYLYFVDARKRSSTLYRLLVRYSTICRIILRKTSPTSTIVYLQLLHPPLLYKVCAGNSATSQCHREGDYLPQSASKSAAHQLAHPPPCLSQFDLSDTTPWDRAVEFGEGPFKCGADVLGRSRVMRLTLSGPRHWAPLSNLILRTRKNAQVFYAPVRELQASELKAVARPSVKDFGVVYALLSVWSESFQHVKNSVLVARYHAQVFRFRTALEHLYFRYRAHRQRADVFTGSVIAQELPSHMVKVRKVILTPTRRVYMPPQLVCKSRLLQHFDPDYALRIAVRDDDCKLISFSLGACKDDFLSAVIKPPLSSGLKIGGRRFMFLGCSTSQLRNHGVWFYAHDNQGRTAEQIRDGIGDLSTILSVPKFMARLGQVHHALELEEDEEPCAVQIRYGGCKGMLLLDPTLSGLRVVFRESMRKFHSDHSDLYVLKTSKPRVLYLNRPMITILEQSGIKADVFLTLQNKILDSFIDSMMDPHEAAQVLSAYCAMRLPYKELAGVDIDLTVEPFFRALVRAVNKKVLKELRTKARILVPPNCGRTMFGVLDETGTLEYGQVFVQYSNDMLRYKVNDPATILEGSDLDGDEYSVLWYEDLIFKNNCHPMHYYSEPPKERKADIGVQDMVDFFCQYIKGDNVGLTANAHLVWADMLDVGINSRRCRELARKCAVNLDFAKCGEIKGFHNSEKPPMYAMKIRALLKSYRIESESEALSGAVSKLSKYVKENDPTDIAIVLESHVEHVMRRTREEFFSEQLDEARENLKASAWYQVTYELQSSEGGIQSFPWVVSDVLMRIVVNTSPCLPVPASPRNSFSQRLGALLLGRPHPGGGDQDDAQHGDTQVLTNLLRLMYDWIDSSREFLFVKDPEELVLYKNIMREACVKVSRTFSSDMPPHKLVILCLRFACAWCLKIFQGGSDGEIISKECRRRYRLGHLALITLNRLSVSGNLAYLHRAPERCPSTEMIRIYIAREDEEFFLILRRYQDVFTTIMIEWSGVEDIQCDLKTDRMDEWFLQLMVTGSRWALERLKEIVVYPSFREVLSLVFKREISLF
ncbi:hypothetical protein V5799_019422 [Amblyomma americanum]|uniref:RNA-dependent RNA polymerase n=1 Tax=Amblyomma americanum TaxID=6943 RepID=A0AAQ4EWK1_AMBAM